MKCPPSVKTPEDYLAWLPEERRPVIETLHQGIRKAAPGLAPHICYGMLGYGPVSYKTKSGCEGEWFVVGLAAQKNHFALYYCCADEKGYLAEQHADRLGKVSCGKSCVRFKKLEDLDTKVAMSLVKQAAKMHREGKTCL